MSLSGESARPAEPSDDAFLEALFFEIRAPEFEQAGLNVAQLIPLLSQQYQAMRAHYERVYPEALVLIIESDGQPIGYYTFFEGDSLHLIDIAISGEFRCRGIGTRFMKRLLDMAATNQRPMTLTVEIFNPAKRLYERLGFVVSEESGIYQRMRWSPTT